MSAIFPPPMTRPNRAELAVQEARITEANEGVLNGTYQSGYEAAKMLNVPQSTVHD